MNAGFGSRFATSRSASCVVGQAGRRIESVCKAPPPLTPPYEGGEPDADPATRRCLLLGILLLNVLAVSAARAADVQPLLRDAQRQYEQSRFEQALKLYKQAADTAGADAAVDYNMSLCHLKLGDGDKAIALLEGIASRADLRPALRRDAFYNIGAIRTMAARGRLEKLLAPATQPSDPKPDEQKQIEELQGVAAELLRGIAAFKQSEQIEANPDTEQNIRAARIMRRDVLGLIRKATEEKAKKDMLDDPRAYMDSLVTEQARQAGISRLFVMKPPEDPVMARQARRAAVRLQRQTMEQTGTFADHLGQFQEQAKTTSAPTTQKGAETPREKLYHAVAAQLKPAKEAMRDACAFCLDGQMDSTYKQQRQALEALRTAAAMFPLDPGQALARHRTEQAELIKLVTNIEAKEHWLRDPLVGNVAIGADATWEPKDTAVYDMQDQIGKGLARLAQQARYVATTTQPVASEQSEPGQQKNPALDKELNKKLADLLDKVATPQTECLTAIAERNKDATAAAQKKIAEAIDAALDLFPKSIEQRLGELIVRQARLNAETQAEANDAKAEAQGVTTSLMGKIHELTTRLKAAVFRTKPADAAKAIGEKQRDIKKETLSVAGEVKKKIPSNAAQQRQPAPTTQGGEQSQVQAYIEAGKHIEKADFEMATTIEGLDKAVVENTLKPLQSEGPVPPAQANALEELKKALAALQPPENKQQDKQDQQKQQQKQQKQQQPDKQDVRRETERQDNEREKAKRELYKVRPREVIKDW